MQTFFFYLQLAIACSLVLIGLIRANIQVTEAREVENSTHDLVIFIAVLISTTVWFGLPCAWLYFLLH
jgi:hypothetical protein